MPLSDSHTVASRLLWVAADPVLGTLNDSSAAQYVTPCVWRICILPMGTSTRWHLRARRERENDTKRQIGWARTRGIVDGEARRRNTRGIIPKLCVPPLHGSLQATKKGLHLSLRGAHSESILLYTSPRNVHINILRTKEIPAFVSIVRGRGRRGRGQSF